MTLQATETLQNGPFQAIFNSAGNFVGFLNPRANGADLRIGGDSPVPGTFTTLTATTLTVTGLSTLSTLTVSGNAALGDAEATDTHTIKGATTLLANSANPALTITQTGSGNAFVVEDATSPDSTPFFIDGSGVLVSGHTASLAVQASTYLAEFLGSGSNYPLAAGYTGASATGSRFSLFKNRNASWGTHTVLANNDIFGQIDFAGSDGTAYVAGARIEALVDGTPGTNDMPGRLVFSTTADGASSPTERMRIDSAGNVGIGGSPTKLLHLTSSDQSTLRIRLTNSGAGGRSWEFVGGLDGANNSSFSIYDSTAAATRLNINSVGGFGFGIAAAADTSFYFGKDIDGATTAYGARFTQTINSAVVTTTGIGCISQNGTSGATTTVHQVRAEQGTFAGAVTNQMGFIAGSSLTGATNNYGFYANIAAAANRWNFYAAGTAQNYFAGVTGIGVVPASTSNLTVAASTTAVSSLNIPHGAAPTSPVDGDMWTTTAGLFVRINGATVGPLS